MPKLRTAQLPVDPTYTTMAQAYNHFRLAWYEDKEPSPELLLAFLNGASYLKALVHQARKKTPAEAKIHIGKLYDELADLSPKAAKAALTAAAFQSPPVTPKIGASAPMDLQPPAPQPGEEPKAPPPPPPAPAVNPEPVLQPMTWTIGMLREFEVCHKTAFAQKQETFDFKDHTFRTVDAPAIIKHLTDVFKNG